MPEIRFGSIGVGSSHPLLLIAGPCVIESPEICFRIATTLKEACEKRGVSYVFKASFDKANRTSGGSFRGPGVAEGLATLKAIKDELGLPVISDIHEISQIAPAAEVLDLLQIPAFLCRQTDLLLEAGRTGLPVNIKKGQFMAPWDMIKAADKVRETGNTRVMLTERGTTFGYNNLVVDMRSLAIMRSLGCPVIFDGTHSVQLPGGQGDSSGGQREFVLPLSRAAAAIGIDGLFWEVHPDPAKALCDGPNSLSLDQVEDSLDQVLAIHRGVPRD